MSVYKRKSGRYAVVIAETEGSTKRKSVGTFDTRKEAQKAERDALQARDRGYTVAPKKKLSVSELMHDFISHCKADPEHHTAATIESYTNKSRHYIEPTLGKIMLSKLTPSAVAEWRIGLRATISRRGTPLSAKTVHTVFGLLHAALDHAVGLEYVGRNVCKVKAARPARFGTTAHAGAALTDEEIRRLLAVAEPTRWYSLIVLALATGARRGELCGLSWDDLDLEARKMRIRHALSQTTGCVELKDTKTHRERRVGLSVWALEALRRQRIMQAEERLRARIGSYVDSGAVFTNAIGERVSPMAATKAFAKLAARACISTRRLHDLRHTAASHLIADGSDAVSVAAVLGHENANITLAVYSHAFEDAKHEATDRLGDRMARIAAGAN